MKLSQDIEKVTIPGKKEAFRLYGGDGKGVDFALSIWLGWAGEVIFSSHLSCEIQNPRLPWIALHGLKNSWGKKASIQALVPARDFDSLR